LGLPSAVAVSWVDVCNGTPIGEILVRLQAEGRALEVILRDAKRTASWQSDGIQVTCCRARCRDPRRDEVLRPLLACMAERFTSSTSGDGSSSALRAALSAVRVYSSEGIDDYALRRVERNATCDSGMIWIGFRCNQNCSFCFQGRHWPDPPRALVFRWVDELAAANIPVLTVTGGEPTTYSWLPELVAHGARKHGMRVSLQTNAMLFSRPGYVQRLVDAGLAGALVALHSADAAISDSMTRAPGSHQRTVDGIRNALDAGLWIFLNCCVEEANVEGLAEHARFVVEQLVEPYPHNPVARVEYSQPGKHFDREQPRRSVAPFDRVGPNLIAAARLLRDAGVPVECTGTCGFPPCLFASDPSLARWRRRASFDPQRFSWRSLGEPCRRCAASSHCLGLRPEYLAIHGTRGVIPFAEMPVVTEFEEALSDYRRGDTTIDS
jgi:organic radical activating enzyme